ncbi:hypothetical protein G816_04470 [Escherichia coli HVH 158 (4-3224287)]|nr:hypothetical protein G816_04470 [Escherichia coli HVH 158 (4-3224287)]
MPLVDFGQKTSAKGSAHIYVTLTIFRVDVSLNYLMQYKNL